jgi:YegS/Rv2252/BmrU family lipid kinase
MTSVAVVAHAGKQLDGGLGELRRLLESEVGEVAPWCEVRHSRTARREARRCVREGADLIVVWGGDGTVQRVVDAVAGADVTIGVIPAGTANLLATNLGIPTDLAAAVDVALHGSRRDLDVGVINGERFAVMAGSGFDASMIRAAKRRLKDRFGRLSYVFGGLKATARRPTRARVDVDGKPWFKGRAGCVLFGSMGTLTGGLVAFPHADPTDGALEIGVVTASTRREWVRVFVGLALGRTQHSPLVRTTRGRRADVRLARPLPYQLDGGDRPPTKRLRVRAIPAAVRVAVPSASGTPR